jgi:hypothetical protein
MRNPAVLKVIKSFFFDNLSLQEAISGAHTSTQFFAPNEHERAQRLDDDNVCSTAIMVSVSL